jgi:hypothetical protein
VLSLVLPKGSLEKATLELFDSADLAVRRGSGRDYRASVDDPRIDSVMFLRPQEIPRYVEQGLFDVGIRTGVPVGFGVLTCDNEEQALDRAGLEGSHEDKGAEAAEAAVATVVALRALRGTTSRVPA